MVALPLQPGLPLVEAQKVLLQSVTSLEASIQSTDLRVKGLLAHIRDTAENVLTEECSGYIDYGEKAKHVRSIRDLAQKTTAIQNNLATHAANDYVIGEALSMLSRAYHQVVYVDMD